MERLNCFVCKEYVLNGLNGLVYHFKFVHGLTINRGVGVSGFECGQDACKRRFSLFNSLRKHIQKVHLPRDRIDLPVEDAEFLQNKSSKTIVHHMEQDDVEHLNNSIAGNDDDNPDDNNDVPTHEDEFRQFDLKLSVVRMIARLQSKSSVTGAVLTDVLDEYEELLFDTVNFLKYHVRQFFDERDMIDTPPVEELLQKFEFDSPFEVLGSLNQQIDVLKTHCGYINPSEIPLGQRIDNVLDSETGTYVPKVGKETFQYVPIIDVLSLVLSNDDVKETILSEEPSAEGVIGSFIDGDQFKNNPFFQRYPHALRIDIYYDDLEVVNPLGSKTGSHKLGVFLMKIQNVPEQINSVLGSIHVLCLCYSADVKKYGFQPILQPFLRDLEKLESDNGVIITLQDSVGSVS